MALANEADGVNEPFLEKSAGHGREDNVRQNSNETDIRSSSRMASRCPRSYAGVSARHVLLHIGLVALYTILSALTIYALRHDPIVTSAQRYTPPAWLPDVKLNPAPVVFYSSASPFTRPASNATIESAWSSLLAPINMRATDDELTLSGIRSSAKLISTTEQDSEANNLVWLDAFHELQCLDLLRRSLGSSPETARRSESDLPGDMAQVTQCIEVLRQNIMCQPDLTLTGLKQTESGSQLVVDTRRRVKECVDWEGIMDSLRHRVVSEEEMAH